MNTFWNLVSYEYKKIFKRKGAVITLILAAAVSLFSVFGTIIGYVYDSSGEPVMSRYDDMKLDLEYAEELSGRAIDTPLILEAAGAYSKLRMNTEEGYANSSEYEEYARKYSEIYSIVRSVYSTASDRFDVESFINMTKEQADDFYDMRRKNQEQTIGLTRMSDRAKQSVLAADSAVKKPIVFEVTEGYGRFFAIMYTTGIIAAIAAAIVFAPLFSGEYTSGADSLILSSKHGKGLLVWAKLFVMLTLSAGYTVILTVLTYAECMAVWGADGAGAALQLLLPMSSYPLSMGQCAVIYSVCILAACIMTAALTALFSAGIKTPFGTIVIMSVIIIAPMMMNVSENIVWLYKLFCLLPSNMMGFWSIIDDIQFELFGLVIRPYVFTPIFAAVFAVVFSLFAYRVFRKRQVN
ncbi:MAG: ABC transporter permease [Oscillospiraceae bacterium]